MVKEESNATETIYLKNIGLDLLHYDRPALFHGLLGRTRASASGDYTAEVYIE